MKIPKSIIAFLLLVIPQYCDIIESDNGHAQIIPDDSLQIVPGDDSLIPDTLKTLFKEDAARLALRDVHSDSTKKENLVILPEDVVKAYYNGLVHIYNADLILARDSVIKIYKIHAFRHPETHSLIVSVDSTKE